jgi:5,10-methylenetetrahydromethanopterin reductase
MTAVSTASRGSARDPDREVIRFGLMGSGATADPAEIERWAQHCEQVGAALLAAGEGATLLTDPYLWLLIAARVTTRLQLGAILSVPGVRHPAVHANTLATLQRLSHRRMFLGVGSGDLGRLELGLGPATLAEVESYARTVQALSGGEAAVVDGARVQVRWAGPADRVPLLLGADGPRAQNLAGRIADAVVVGQAAHPDIVRQVLANVRAGAEGAGRRAGDVRVWLMCRAYVTDRDNGAIYTDGLDEYGARQAEYFWRTAGSPGEHDVVAAIRARKGITLAPGVGPRLVRYCREFSAQLGWTAGDKSMVELLEHYELREWAGRMFYLSGPADSVRERIAELVDAGGRNFVVPQMLGDRYEAARAVAGVFAGLNAEGVRHG